MIVCERKQKKRQKDWADKVAERIEGRPYHSFAHRAKAIARALRLARIKGIQDELDGTAERRANDGLGEVG